MSDSIEHSLDADLQALESLLASLTPRAIPEDVFSRVELVLAQNDQVLSISGKKGEDAMSSQGDLDGFEELEDCLSQLAPKAMPDDMLTRMSQAMDSWHEHATESDKESDKVLPFTPNKSRVPKIFNRGMLSAAAAVAVLGAVTALVMPQFSPSQNQSYADTSPAFPAAGVTANLPKDTGISSRSGMASDGLSHQVTRTTDSGVIFSGDNQPLRCIRVDYVDQIKGVDASGRDVEIKTPGIDYILIPMQTD